LPYARVLLVDDVPANLEIARGMLKPYRMRVDVASNGRRAIELVREGKIRYQAIFMDHMMPDLDGIEAVRKIREIDSEYARTVPVIALTANAITGTRRLFLDSGFQDYLSKPIDLAQLDAALMRWVRNRDLENGSSGRSPGAAAASGRPFPELGPIAGLDQEAALARFGGDREAFLRSLRSYAGNTLRLIARMDKPDEKGLAAYAIAAHGIKGSSYGVGAGRLGRLAEDLEAAASSGDIGFIRDNHAVLAAMAEKLLSELTGRLAELDREGGKLERDEPEAALLERLRLACGNYDMDGVDRAMAELESFAYGRGGDLVAWLRERVSAMDFRQIVDELPARAAERGNGGST
ncbi:MAG: response regulator, partial [Planctomycetota bacterium]|nr:response regulator [Planctomycetota bacterium]